MKTAEEFVSKWSVWWITNNNKNVLNRAFENELKEIIEQAQKEAYNQAIEDAVEWGYKEAMRYLITTNIQPPFLSNWFDAENHFNAEVGMVVYDLAEGVYTTNGEKWEQIEEDHL